MTMPAYPKIIYDNKIYLMADMPFEDMENLKGGREIFNLTEGALTTSVGLDCVTTYGLYENRLYIEEIFYMHNKENAPEIHVQNRYIKREPIYYESAHLRNRKWITVKRLWGYKYLDVKYPINWTGKVLISFYDNESKISDRRVLYFKNGILIDNKPWIKGGDLQGLIDRSCFDYYSGEGYKILLDEGFTKEELRTVTDSYLDSEEFVNYMINLEY